MTDVVKFLMPDGTEVSNHPSFGLDKALEKALAATPNTGNTGWPVEDETAQRQNLHAATMNSGQPGVGDNAVPEDPEEFSSQVARQRQAADAQAAAYEGYTPTEPQTQVSNPDSNEKVLAVRKEREEKARAALEAAGEEPGDPNKPYKEWTSKQLKLEMAQRGMDTAGIKNKSDAAAALDQYDEEHSADEDELEDNEDEANPAAQADANAPQE